MPDLNSILLVTNLIEPAMPALQRAVILAAENAARLTILARGPDTFGTPHFPGDAQLAEQRVRSMLNRLARELHAGRNMRWITATREVDVIKQILRSATVRTSWCQAVGPAFRCARFGSAHTRAPDTPFPPSGACREATAVNASSSYRRAHSSLSTWPSAASAPQAGLLRQSVIARRVPAGQHRSAPAVGGGHGPAGKSRGHPARTSIRAHRNPKMSSGRQLKRWHEPHPCLRGQDASSLAAPPKHEQLRGDAKGP